MNKKLSKAAEEAQKAADKKLDVKRAAYGTYKQIDEQKH